MEELYTRKENVTRDRQIPYLTSDRWPCRQSGRRDAVPNYMYPSSWVWAFGPLTFQFDVDV